MFDKADARWYDAPVFTGSFAVSLTINSRFWHEVALKMHNHHDQPLPARHEPRRQNRLYQRKFQAARRLLIATKYVWIRRSQHEQQLILQDVEPRFRLSFERLMAVVDNPQWLAGGFGKFIHRLRRLANCETDEAVRAYHAVAKPGSQPKPTAQNEPPKEES